MPPPRPPHTWQTENNHAGRLGYLSHELFGGEDQLVVDDPAGQLFEEGAVGVHEDRLLVLHRLVAALAEPRGVVEVAGCHGLEEQEEAGEQRRVRSRWLFSRGGEGSLEENTPAATAWKLLWLLWNLSTDTFQTQLPDGV